MELKKKEVDGTALIDLGRNGSMRFESIKVYMTDDHETDLTMSIVDGYNAENKIQLSFKKPEPAISDRERKAEIKKKAVEELEKLKSIPDDKKTEQEKKIAEMAAYIVSLGLS